MKELIERFYKITIPEEFYTENKSLYGKYFYFFKREIKQDHYFTHLGKFYVLRHNSDNYNPSITETGKHEDSFKIHIDKCELLHLNGFKDQIEEPKNNNAKVLIYLEQVKELINKIEKELDAK